MPRYQAADYRVFQELPNLEELIFFDAPFHGEGAKHLANIQHLKTLIIQQTHLTDADIRALASLGQLESLSLVQSTFNDVGLLQLSRMNHLGHLDLRGTGVLAKTVSQLRIALPACRIVTDHRATSTPPSNNSVNQSGELHRFSMGNQASPPGYG